MKAAYPVIPTAQAPSWRDRHPYLKIGVGAAVLLLMATIPLTLVFATYRGSEVYKESLARAQASPQVQQWLGAPIEAGWFITGELKVSGDHGAADISIPISGPRGKASIRTIAYKSHSVWKFQQMTVSQSGRHETIDLLAVPRTPESGSEVVK